MVYSESADIAQHRTEFDQLRDVIDALGLSVSGYCRGIDIGGGLGMHAPWLLEMCERLFVTDVVPYSALHEGALFRLIVEKFARNSTPFAYQKVEFHQVDAQDLMYKDGYFDLVYSINAMEHIPDPRKAMAEIMRVTQPNGLVVLQFDPLWNSAFGHHLWHLGLEPWAHLLDTEAAFIERIGAAGGKPEDIEVYLGGTNRRPYSCYREIIDSLGTEHFKFKHVDWWAKDVGEEAQSSHPNYARCLKAGFGREELLTRGMRFIGVRA